MKITLATLPQATAEQVAAQIEAHLLTQNKRSVNDQGACKYRGWDDTQCAAGCLISEDEHCVSMESNTWSALVHQKKVPGDHAELIRRYQRVHDLAPPELWPSILSLNIGKMKVSKFYYLADNCWSLEGWDDKETSNDQSNPTSQL